jgi:predicted metalloendopeptidase
MTLVILNRRERRVIEQLIASTSEATTLRLQLTTDGHAPDEYRADTVRNLDAWYQAYSIQPGRKLYLSPEARVRVW